VKPFLLHRALFGLVLPLCAFSRPLLPELPLGTGSASFAGGGAAHSSGLNSIFDNPAALSVRDQFQAEAGLMGLAGGVSPYFLCGSQGVGKSSYAFGYFYDARKGDPQDPVRPALNAPRQGLIAGASWEVFPWAMIGGSARSIGTGAGVGRNGFGIDEDAGAMFRPWDALWLGLAARNLQESGVGPEPGGFRTRRSYSASVGTGLASLHLIGISFHDPDAYYEFRSAGLPGIGHLAHAFSVASGFTPGGKLGFRGTFLLPQDGTPGFALGTFLNVPLGRDALVCAYTFQTGGSEETGEAGASHSLSINFRLGSRLDPLPPSVEVRADRALAAPQGDSLPALVHFRLSASDKTYVPGRIDNDADKEDGESPVWAGRKPSLEEGRTLSEGRIKEWTLIIKAVGTDGVGGAEVKTFHGQDLPPRVIRWDAVDAAGKRLPPGFYSFRLDALDMAGNQGRTAWQLLEISPSQALSGN
jgi:hypothetical protein